jgi:hypothetical protein
MPNAKRQNFYLQNANRHQKMTPKTPDPTPLCTALVIIHKNDLITIFSGPQIPSAGRFFKLLGVRQ